MNTTYYTLSAIAGGALVFIFMSLVSISQPQFSGPGLAQAETITVHAEKDVPADRLQIIVEVPKTEAVFSGSMRDLDVQIQGLADQIATLAAKKAELEALRSRINTKFQQLDLPAVAATTTP